MPMTTDEAREWFRELAGETGVSQDNDKNRESDIQDLIKNQQKDPSVWLPRSDADIEKQKAKYVQQYALRGATGGRRDKGGYSTDIEDDPERTWTRRTPYIAAQDETPATGGYEGQAEIAWKTPDPLEPLSPNQEHRVWQMYERFLGRTPTQEEVDSHLSGHTPGWQQRLYREFRYDPEYSRVARQKIIDLYKKYRGDDAMPSESEIRGHLGNESGLAGVEHALSQYPSEAYKLANPYLPFREAREASGWKPAREEQAAMPASWSGPVPTMQDIVDDPADDTDPDPLPQVPTQAPPAIPRAQPVAAAPLPPYSARAARPPSSVNQWGSGTPVGTQMPLPVAPGVTPSTNMAASGFPTTGATGQAPFIGTIGGMTAPPPTNQWNAQSWNAYNAPYWNAGQDFQAGPTGQPFDPAPWLGETDTDARQRADDFWRRETLGDQYNTNLRTSDAGNQMDRWVRAYNQWMQRGAGPSSPIDRDPRFGPYQSYGYGGF